MKCVVVLIIALCLAGFTFGADRIEVDLANGTSRAAFSPDDKRIVAADFQGVSLVNPADGKVLRTATLKVGPIYGLSYSPDGTRVACAGVAQTAGGPTVVIIDSETLRPLASWQPHPKAAVGVSYSPDSKRLVTGGGNTGPVIVWNASDQTEVAKLDGHTGAVNALAFSPDGKFLATGCWGGDFILSSTATLGQIIKDRPHGDRITATCFSKDSRLVASISRDGSIQVWDTTKLKPYAKLVQAPASYVSGAFIGEPAVLVTAGIIGREHGLAYWDMANKTIDQNASGRAEPVACCWL